MHTQTLLTNHAELRCAQWNVSHDDIDFIVKYAKPQHRAGATFYQFRNKSLPEHFSRDDRYRRLIGTTVVACKHCQLYVLTVYRNPRAFKADGRKRKYNINSESHYCPCCENEIVA